MPKYEYKRLDDDEVFEEELNDLGAQGYRIVAVIPEGATNQAQVILMREVPMPVDHTLYQPVKTANGVTYTPIAAQQISIEEAFSTFED